MCSGGEPVRDATARARSRACAPLVRVLALCALIASPCGLRAGHRCHHHLTVSPTWCALSRSASHARLARSTSSRGAYLHLGGWRLAAAGGWRLAASESAAGGWR